MIGVGIVGYGAQFSMGKHHADQIRAVEGLELRGVYDTAVERRQAAVAEQPGVQVYEAYDQMLSDPKIELVVLVTPHDTHAPLSIAASQAGKHVMTEKVMCLNVKEADAMIAAAKEARKVLTVYQNRRWDGDYLTVKKVVTSGLLGPIFSVESSVNGWWLPSGWRSQKSSGGGMLYDWGAHLSDQIVQLMLPAKPHTVFATFHEGGHDIDVETHSTVVITFDNGVFAQIDVGCVSHLTRPRWLIRGEGGAFEMRDWEHGRLRTEVAGLRGEMEVDIEQSNWRSIYQNLSDHLNKGEDLAVKPEEVRIGISILEAAFESSRVGSSVTLF